jgi:hypothetical protein
MAEGEVRRGLLLKRALEILRDAGTKVPQSRALGEEGSFSVRVALV